MRRCLRRRPSGFTLLEVLVGLTILGAMTALLVSALFTLVTGARAGEARFEKVDAARFGRAFLRDQIERAYPLMHKRLEQSLLAFDGQRNRLTFVGHLPAHRGGGGLQILRLFGAQRGAVRALFLQSRPVSAGPDDSSGNWSERVLLEEIESVTFSYFGAPGEDEPRTWHQQWRDSDSLPELIRIEVISSTARPLPPLVIAVRTRTPENQPQLVVDEASI